VTGTKLGVAYSAPESYPGYKNSTKMLIRFIF